MTRASDSFRTKELLGLPGRLWIILTVEVVVFAAFLFGAAGTFEWPAAWGFLALFAGCVFPMSIALYRHDPGMMNERGRSPIQADQPLWDKLVMLALLAEFVLLFVVAGLDYRFGWSGVAQWLQLAAGMVFAGAMWLTYRVMRHNSFLAPVVKIQRERRQTVVSTGPYAIVRHPFYASLGPAVLAIALLLGSWWAVAIAGLVVFTLAVRCVREERHLADGLEGYSDYMETVRYRLVPGVW